MVIIIYNVKVRKKTRYMDFMREKKEYAEKFSKYAINALKKLGYSEKNIKFFLAELENQIKLDNFQKDESNPNKSSENIKQVIFEGIEIPTEYNISKIRDLFERHGLMKKEHNRMTQRICNALERKHIVYVKDLYGKTKKDITNIKSIGEISFDFFIRNLNKICSFR